jgi:hypothetical protein
MYKYPHTPSLLVLYLCFLSLRDEATIILISTDKEKEEIVILRRNQLHSIVTSKDIYRMLVCVRDSVSPYMYGKSEHISCIWVVA